MPAQEVMGVGKKVVSPGETGVIHFALSGDYLYYFYMSFIPCKLCEIMLHFRQYFLLSERNAQSQSFGETLVSPEQRKQKKRNLTGARWAGAASSCSALEQKF